ncbi:hypothetical protein [Pseudonocardia sp.]|uniref:hypothetical protein n=1 Tax=Pseudonocardia sp. TaxID=60912 RepID=UPI0031FDAA16
MDRLVLRVGRERLEGVHGDIASLDPADAELVQDDSSYRSRLWVEGVLRKTPVPLHDQRLTSARTCCSTRWTSSQAVAQALDPARLRPRLLIADAVGPGIAPTSPDTSAIAGGRPDKTGIVYCKDNNRPGRFDRTAFTFLGYTFRSRPARDRHGKTFLAFLPAISPQALKKISTHVRRHWRWVTTAY